MTKLFLFFKALLPNALRDFFIAILEPTESKVRRTRLIKEMVTLKSKMLPEELYECIRYLKWHKYSALPFKWANKYDYLRVFVNIDPNNSFYYVLFHGKRMYYPKKYSYEQVIWSHRNSLKEQDSRSPHKYLTNNFTLLENTVVIDAGVAEGNFALEIIDFAKLLILIEPDQDWIEALKLTFMPWMEKVVIISKYLSEKNDNQNITIGEVLKNVNSETIFIKMDIEGYERNAIAGIGPFLKKYLNVRLVICTYHHQNDLDEISNILTLNNIAYEISEGYIFYFTGNEIPSFRKALIRAQYSNTRLDF